MGSELETCAYPGCSEPIPEDKLFCTRHWNGLTRKEQTAVFEAWSYGMSYLDEEEEYDSSGD